eukprot:TRINITY_DN7156_c0_g1_i1.p1 TRINITY_DN7156_c0_g1~~TRINITY_DN7156_c0_g1_i1.p1  ORF type:complete len:515 (+),score=190.48 TRINITY_DN7156_c0_g1_i1:82-1545(+)
MPVPSALSASQPHQEGDAQSSVRSTARKSRYAPQEQDIRQWAIDFDNAEAQKEVKWETNRGELVPTEEEIDAVLQTRQELRAAREAARQREDCLRRECRRDPSDRVVVALPAPPPEAPQTAAGGSPPRRRLQEGDPRFDQAAGRAFDPSPADRVRSRQRLLDIVVLAGRSYLHRVRAQARIRRALDARQGKVDAPPADPALSSCDVYFTKVVVPTSSIVRQRENVRRPEPVSAEREFADPIALKEPFAFQLKSYRPHPFPEHPFLNSDPPVETSVYPAGTEEVPELGDEEQRRQWDTSAFVEPPPSQAHFPTESFCFQPPLDSVFFPYDMKQDESDAGAKEPYRDYSFCTKDVPPSTLNRTYRSRHALNPELAPALHTHALDEDRMSDTEDETAGDLPTTHPKSLGDIADWLHKLTQSDTDLLGSLPVVREEDSDCEEADGAAYTQLAVHSHDALAINPQFAERLPRFQQIESRVRECLPLRLHKLF